MTTYHKSKSTGTIRTAGPVIWREHKGGAMSLRCLVANYVCVGCNGGRCTETRPARAIPNVRIMPDWCPLRAQAESDMADLQKQEGTS